MDARLAGKSYLQFREFWISKVSSLRDIFGIPTSTVAVLISRNAVKAFLLICSIVKDLISIGVRLFYSLHEYSDCHYTCEIEIISILEIQPVIYLSNFFLSESKIPSGDGRGAVVENLTKFNQSHFGLIPSGVNDFPSESFPE